MASSNSTISECSGFMVPFLGNKPRLGLILSADAISLKRAATATCNNARYNKRKG